jgi:3-oxoadipate enol-lactonase
VNGINVNYQVDGQGEPLLLLCGIGQTVVSWHFQMDAFTKRHRVVRLDNRGTGGTSVPGEPFTVGMLADDAVGLMDHLGIDKGHVLGICSGGQIAQEIAASHPERVRKLVLVSTYATTPVEVLRAIGLDEGYCQEDVRNVNPFKASAVLASLSVNSRKYQLILPICAQTTSRLVLVREGLLANMEASIEHSTMERLHLIQAPTMVLCGTADRLVPFRHYEMLARGIPNSRLVKIEGGPHFLLLETRSLFNRTVLRFLRD